MQDNTIIGYDYVVKKAREISKTQTKEKLGEKQVNKFDILYSQSFIN